MHHRQSLALTDTVHSQEIEQPYVNINSGLLVRLQSSLNLCILFSYTGEREREVEMHTFVVFCLIPLVTYQDDGPLEECSLCSLCTLSRSV